MQANVNELIFPDAVGAMPVRALPSPTFHGLYRWAETSVYTLWV